MSRLVAYAEWPESQALLECKHSLLVNETDARICLNDNCICLQLGYTRDEDKVKDDDEQQPLKSIQ